MKKMFYVIAMALACAAIISVTLQGCAKSGDSTSDSSSSEPELTIVGEAI